MSEHFNAVMATPLPGGLRLGIRVADGAITHIDFLPADHPLKRPSAAAEPAVATLKAYFADAHNGNRLPLHTGGTAFQQRVWAAMRAIPVGEVRTYGELAEQLRSGPRAVAGACRANPIPILIPCHRVVARTGLGGYMGELYGDPLVLKEWLLHHEGAC
jgi:methylated-DNA-[protein]-cysteine S-methyltransferase